MSTLLKYFEKEAVEVTRARSKSADANFQTGNAKAAVKGATPKRSAESELLRDEAAKRLCLSSQTLATLKAEFPDLVIPKKLTKLHPHYRLDLSTVEAFLNFWIPQVVVADSVVRYGMGGERAKYLPIFSLLGAISVLGNRKVDVAPVEPADVEVGAEEEELELVLTTAQIKQLVRYIGYEEKLDLGSIEFMMFADALTNTVEGFVEVKLHLPSAALILSDPSTKNPTWQFISELLRALDRNGKAAGGVVWGALCDEATWYFGRVSREVDGGVPHLEMYGPLSFQRSRDLGHMVCTEDTRYTLELLFTLIHGTTNSTNHFNLCMDAAIAGVNANSAAAAVATVSSFKEANQAVKFVETAAKAYKADCAAKNVPASAVKFAEQNNVTVELVARFFD